MLTFGIQMHRGINGFGRMVHHIIIGTLIGHPTIKLQSATYQTLCKYMLRFQSRLHIFGQVNFPLAISGILIGFVGFKA